jgi:hypothetical protein
VTFGGRALFELVVGLTGAPTVPSPPPIPLRIVFEAPSDCSSMDAFYAGVRARTERVRLAAPDESATELQVRLSQSGSGAHGELRMLGERGETDTRKVDGGSCEEIVEALSLTAALALDPAARITPEKTPPAEAVKPKPPEPAPPVPPRPPPLEEPTSLGLELGAKVMVSEVVSPFTNVGGELSARLRLRGEHSVEPSIGVAFVRLQNDFFRVPRQASIRYTAVAVSACPARWFVRDIVSLSPCAIFLAGWLGAAGKGNTYNSSVIRSLYGAGGSLTLAVPFDAFALELSGAFTLPLVRRRFVAGVSSSLVGETPSISPFGALGVSYAF